MVLYTLVIDLIGQNNKHKEKGMTDSGTDGGEIQVGVLVKVLKDTK